MRSSIRIPSPPRTSTHCFRPLCTHPPACLFEHHITMGGRSTTTCVSRRNSQPRILLCSNNNKQARHGSPPRFDQVSYIMYERVCVRAGYRHAGGRGRIPVRRPAAGVRVTAFFFFLHSLTTPPNGYLGGGLESVEGRRFVRAPAGVELSAAVVGSVKPSDGAAAAVATVVHSPWRISSSTSSNREGCFHKQLPFQHSDRLLSTRLQTAVVCCSDELREDTSSSVVNGVVVFSPPAARFRFLVSRLAKCCAFVRDH
jgi:hypothetical protein